MKLLIIGGTGGTGKELIKQALEQGYNVTALVRNPEKIKITYQNLTLTQLSDTTYLKKTPGVIY